MERITAIIARCQAIDASQAEIERKAELENSGQFTEEMRAEYATLKAEYDTLIAEKKQIEADAEMRASRSGRSAELQPKVFDRKTQTNSGAAVPDASHATQQPVDSTGANGGPLDTTPRFKIPANVIRIGTLENFKGTVNGVGPEERAYRFGMWALARICQCLPGKYHIPEATRFVNNYMGGMFNYSHGSSDGQSGANVLVPEEFSSDLIVLRERYGVFRRLAGREVMTSDTKHIPKRASGLTAYFVGENEAGTESNMTWQDVLLVAKDVMALTRMSKQLSADAAISVGDKLVGEIAYAFANKEDQCDFNGDGTSTYGGITGIRTLLTNIDGAGTDSSGVVTQGTSNTWAAQVMADFHNVVGKLPQFADTENAAWVCHRTYYSSVMQKLELAAGGATSMEIANGDRRPRPLFLGYPVEFSQVFPSATATTGVMCILGDLKLSSCFGDRQQTSVDFSEHASVGSQSVFERNQIAVRGTERFDINNHGCGDASTPGPVVGLQTG